MLFYVATPYSKHPAGIQAAFDDAALETARLVKHGVAVFSPIVHSHPIAIAGEINPLDHGIWLPVCGPFIARCDGIVMCMMEGWRYSYGMNVELNAFKDAGKPVVWMTPGRVPTEFLPDGVFHTPEMGRV